MEGAGMRISQIFVQGGGYGDGDHSCDCGCDNNRGGPYRRSGYFHSSCGDYYTYNDGIGYNPRPRGGLLGLL
jgi:hypothetical protein